MNFVYGLPRAWPIPNWAVSTCQSFNYDKADENFTQAYSLMSELAEEDRRLSYLNLNYAENLCNLNRHGEAVKILSRELETAGNIYGCESAEYFHVLRKLLLVACKLPSADIHLEEMFPKNINAGVADLRIEAGTELYKAGKKDWLAVSGGDYRNSENGYDEPIAMRDSLMKQGVDSARIYSSY